MEHDRLPDIVREKFEQWARKYFGPSNERLFYPTNMGSSTYFNCRVQDMWTGWQAAVAVAFMEERAHG
jgi:hypothetical protein